MGNGEVGAVFALEASRLARNNRDWHHLIELCVLTRTLVVDADGIDDPRLINDRMLLGLKGTMSEFERGLLRQRAQEAYREKALRDFFLRAARPLLIEAAIAVASSGKDTLPGVLHAGRLRGTGVAVAQLSAAVTDGEEPH